MLTGSLAPELGTANVLNCEVRTTIMKYLLILSITVSLSCIVPKSGSLSSMRILTGKAPLLSFTTIVDKSSVPDTTKISLQLTNISGQTLIVPVPECFGMNIMPHAQDSSGKQMDLMFLVRAYCRGARIVLAPDSSLVSPFAHSVQDCFGAPPSGGYRVYFEYLGPVYDEHGKVISNEVPLESSAVFLE